MRLCATSIGRPFAFAPRAYANGVSCWLKALVFTLQFVWALFGTYAGLFGVNRLLNPPKPKPVVAEVKQGAYAACCCLLPDALANCHAHGDARITEAAPVAKKGAKDNKFGFEAPTLDNLDKW